MSDDDRPPPARSAREKPKQHREVPPSVRRARRVDPRFDPMFGQVNEKLFESNYKFLQEKQEEEQAARRFRIKCLQCVLRRYELEEAGEDLDEYDISEDERETFGPDHADDLAALKLTPPSVIQRELENLKRENILYLSQSKGKAVSSRRQEMRKQLVKREVTAVKEGKKARPFFPKRNEVKRAVLSDTFERLEERGGKSAVDRYLARKSKK